MDNNFFNIENITALADKVSQASLESIEIEINGCKLKIKGKRTQPTFSQSNINNDINCYNNIDNMEMKPAIETTEIAQNFIKEIGTKIKSPIVGTFYAAPAPDKEPFVTVGQKVKKGDVLFIIESMKLMNEVLSDQDGTIIEIIAHDGQAVEYGEPVMIIE